MNIETASEEELLALLRSGELSDDEKHILNVIEEMGERHKHGKTGK